MRTQLKPGCGCEAQMKRNAPTSAHSAAGMMTDLGCWEVGSRERRVQLTFVNARARAPHSRPSLLAVSFRAFSLLDWLLGLHSWRPALHSGLGLVRFIGSGNQV